MSEKLTKLTQLLLFRKTYRMLLNKGRTYAAFTRHDKEIIKSEFPKHIEILDPMSGFGTITKFCSEIGHSSFAIEYNLPQYYWQVLNQPKYAKNFIATINHLLNSRSKLPISNIRATISDEWFPKESRTLVSDLITITTQFVELEFKGKKEFSNLVLALLMPFLGRFSCFVTGDTVTRVKKGGICVYRNWEIDFFIYLEALKEYLENKMKSVKSESHIIYHGDARTFPFPIKRFQGMYHSPPYPNRMDFSSMFNPEHALLELLEKEERLRIKQNIIGSVFVRGKDVANPESQLAQTFMRKVEELKNRKPFQVRHDENYYLPYFRKYFVDIELAYKNIEKSFADDFKGFIVVVNNTHRGLVIPVAEIIVEVWKNLGYYAEIFKSKELSHVGAKNPRSKGVRALHTEYVIKIWK